MKYVVERMEETGEFVVVAEFDYQHEAVDFAASMTSKTLRYHLVTVKDGGKH